MFTRRSPNVRMALLFLAISAFGLAVRFVLVHVPPEFDTRGMCEHVADFWNGDQFLC